THAIATVLRRDDDEIGLDVTFTDDTGRVVGEIRGFVARAIASAPVDASGPVRYLWPAWRESATVPNPGLGSVLVVGPAGVPSAGVTRHVTVVPPDADFVRVLREAGPVEEIVFVATDASDPVPSADGLRAAEETGVIALFRLAKALGSAGRLGAGLTLRVVGRNLHSVGESGPGWPAAAGVVGLARVLANEHPGLAVHVFDTDSLEIDRVLADPGDPVGGVVVVRGGRRFVRRFEETEPADAPVTIRPGGLYVIAGGAGGIGFALGRAWAAAGANVVLLGRRAAPESSDTGMTYIRADVTDPATVRAALAEARSRFGPVRGAVHSALVLRDAPFARMTEADFREVLDVKARGAVVLADATAADPLDFLAFFSSANAFTANPGQANYAAGCTFQDAFGAWLAAAGRPVRVINWGLWGETGRVATPEHLAAIARLGVFP
ncbi:MAG: SDR family NAD(P)-dependent oxidoreductase, partial [Fimbriiglobus sp.]